eukprot:1225328-Rhodomonas_salina.5
MRAVGGGDEGRRRRESTTCGARRRRTRSRSSAGCTSSAPSVMRAAALTRSSVDARAGRATQVHQDQTSCGSSRFFLALDDKLFQVFGGSNIDQLLKVTRVLACCVLRDDVEARVLQSQRCRADGLSGGERRCRSKVGKSQTEGRDLSDRTPYTELN